MYIYGAKRNNHASADFVYQRVQAHLSFIRQDMYLVTLDGQIYSADGYARPNMYQQVLFAQEGLEQSTEHQVILQNNYTTSTPSWVDVDWIVITSGDGNPE